MTETKGDLGIFVGLESWKTILEKAGIHEAYNKVKDISDLCPPKEMVLNAFKYFKPQHTSVIIIGQDPYSNGDACGSCFATINGNCPKSLVNIYNNLIENELCPRNVNRNGNLKSWAAQGVLLLNTALTTTSGKTKQHMAIWSNFTIELLKQINELEQQLYIYLWGNDAKAFGKYFTYRRHTVLKWTHPSPMSDNSLPEHLKFKKCDHFKSVKSVDWNPYQKIMAWSDGACSGNGKDDAKAAFASMILGGYMGKTTISGKVRPHKYVLSGDLIVCDEKSKETPTNNRGELLGIIYALWGLDQSYIVGEVEIVSDSKYGIDCLNDYYPKRLAKCTEHELVNLDLLEIGHKLIRKLGSHTKIEFVHTRSHQTLPDDADDRTKCIHAGNAMIDSVAVSAKEYQNYEVIIDTKLPALLKYK